MARDSRRHALGGYARAGFQELSWARDALAELTIAVSQGEGHDGVHDGTRAELLHDPVLESLSLAADPDTALARLLELQERHPDLLSRLHTELGEDGWRRIALLFGASPAFSAFFLRRPERLLEIIAGGGRLVARDEACRELLAAVGARPITAGPESGHPLFAAEIGDQGATALRVRYRELLAETVLYDLTAGVSGKAADSFEQVAGSLSDLADAALEAGLAVARGSLLEGASGAPVSPERIAATEVAIIAMGKCGARELNVVSDVDVMFIVEPLEAPECRGAGILDTESAIRIGTRLAAETMRAIHDHGIEPPLWQVDANLRPEGKQGALVRSLGSMLNYYERWAKTWEFQALLKARSAAGAIALGERFVEQTRSMVWTSSSREDFVGSVQRMRERVTEHIDPEELERQLKLGPGGLRDIEFSVQLLQLVHGQYEDGLHLAGTLPALRALVAGGYVAREDGERLANDYRTLRVLEHRLQLRELRRTALIPGDEDALRILARSSRIAATGPELLQHWRSIRNQVRELHLKIFYAPLLSAVAALPGEEFALGSDQARARLQSIGFRDPEGAMRHLAALTKGSSRTARIQRNLMPVLLQWLAEGTDPDYGLLAFRRVSEANLETPWYLRLLRDGTEAAERLTRVLSSSRFAAELLESIPEAVAWLEKDELLHPLPLGKMLDEMRFLASRRVSLQDAAAALRAVHRREVLRLALGRIVFVLDDREVADGLDTAHTALLDGLLLALRGKAGQEPASTIGSASPDFELALIGMGRFGGREMGFASDIDLLAVFRFPPLTEDAAGAEAKRRADRTVSELRGFVSDPRFAVDLDFDLRPEGKNGPIVRSLDAYRTYYERWSLTWEAQALLRARPVAGDASLGEAFSALADEIRYPESFGGDEVREVRRIKARVEAERLPRGADPKRHLKLGPGGISDVEWLVQLLQLQHGARVPELRTQSTIAALDAAVEAGLLGDEDRERLLASWSLASRIRSAAKLWNGRGSDVLPIDRVELEGIAGLLGMPGGRTTELEEQWFAASRRARAVFEREFFGYID